MKVSEARRRFAAYIERPPEDIRLAEGALLIALEAYPDLDVDACLQRLDGMAEAVSARLGLELEPRRIASHLNACLFKEQGLRGNRRDYYDTRNSFLNEVLERKVGIPITLSIIYLEVGRRVGLPVNGVGLPGHFIVQYGAHPEPFYIDPFHNGKILSERDCADRVAQIYGRDLPWQASYLDVVDDLHILSRVLNNLKIIYVRKGAHELALGAVERLVLLQPDAPSEIRDRGLLRAQLGYLQPALEDLNTYLEACPEAPDAPAMRRHVAALQRGLRG
jgi:regulator of sirC expression with transglutaminase-like and TPR domain